MKFIELLERLFENDELEFKFEGNVSWSCIEYRTGIFNDMPVGIAFLNNDGDLWWPTDEQRLSDRWEVEGEPLEQKLYKLYVVAILPGECISLKKTVTIGKKKITDGLINWIERGIILDCKEKNIDLTHDDILIQNMIWLD